MSVEELQYFQKCFPERNCKMLWQQIALYCSFLCAKFEAIPFMHFLSKVNIWNVNCARLTAFIFEDVSKPKIEPSSAQMEQNQQKFTKIQSVQNVVRIYHHSKFEAIPSRPSDDDGQKLSNLSNIWHNLKQLKLRQRNKIWHICWICKLAL